MENYVVIGYNYISEYWWRFLLPVKKPWISYEACRSDNKIPASSEVTVSPSLLQFVISRWYKHCRWISAFVHVTDDTKTKVTWLIMRIVAGLSTRTPGFNPRSVEMWYSLDKVALGDNYLPIFCFFPCMYHSTNAPYSSSIAAEDT